MQTEEVDEDWRVDEPSRTTQSIVWMLIDDGTRRRLHLVEVQEEWERLKRVVQYGKALVNTHKRFDELHVSHDQKMYAVLVTPYKKTRVRYIQCDNGADIKSFHVYPVSNQHEIMAEQEAVAIASGAMLYAVPSPAGGRSVEIRALLKDEGSNMFVAANFQNVMGYNPTICKPIEQLELWW